VKEIPLTFGSLWHLIAVPFAGLSREQPDGKNTLSLALAETIRAQLMADDEQVLRWLLAEIAEALDNPKAELRLTLKAAKKGRIISPIERYQHDDDAVQMAEFIWQELQLSGQMEAAIVAAQATYKLSRSTVFARLKAAALRNLDYQRQKWSAAQYWPEDESGVPSPTQTAPANPESDDFDKWLNRYLDETPADEG
jgi:hypothetical protein